MVDIAKLYADEQARKEAELQDLRVLVAALVEKAGGRVTLKHSRLVEMRIRDPLSSTRMPVEIVVDDHYDSVEIRLRKAL